MDGKADEAEVNIRALIFALLALACGHMLSTLLRTIPAISLDVMAADFRTASADAGEPDLDLSFRFRRLANSGRRRDGSLWRPAGLPEPAGGNHRRRAGVRARHRAGEFSVRPIPARRRHLGHADVSDDACRQANVGGAVRPVVRDHPVDRQFRHAAVGEPAGLCRRTLGMARGFLDLRRFWRGCRESPCSCWFRSSRPRTPTSLRHCRRWPRCCVSACRVPLAA